MNPTPPVCTPPATKRQGESLAAPAAARQGACTFSGQSGAGMIPMFMGRNPHQWQHVLDCLQSLDLRADADATGKRSAGAAAADVQAIPVGNHGDNRRSIK
jgi:hypothetical protein